MTRPMVVALVSALAAGCLPEEKVVECGDNLDCNLGANGTCDRYGASGNTWCVYDSDECPGGRAWGSESVGDGLAGSCIEVEPGPDARPGDPDASPPDAGVGPDANLMGTPVGCWALTWVREQGGFSSPGNPLGGDNTVSISETVAAYRSDISVDWHKDHVGSMNSGCFVVPAGQENSNQSRDPYQVCLSEGEIFAVISWHQPSSPDGDIRYRLTGVPAATCD